MNLKITNTRPTMQGFRFVVLGTIYQLKFLSSLFFKTDNIQILQTLYNKNSLCMGGCIS